MQFAVLVVAALVVARGALRLVQLEFNILRFAVLGWPPWAVWAVSAAEILGALLLLYKSSFLAGACLLAATAGGFVLTYLWLGAPEASWGPAGVLAALLGLALLRARERAQQRP
jgi:hypothetical protein